MQKMTVTSVAAATTKLLFAMCDCMVASDVGVSNFLLMLEIFHMCVSKHGHCDRRGAMAFLNILKLSDFWKY